MPGVRREGPFKCDEISSVKSVGVSPLLSPLIGKYYFAIFDFATYRLFPRTDRNVALCRTVAAFPHTAKKTIVLAMV